MSARAVKTFPNQPSNIEDLPPPNKPDSDDDLGEWQPIYQPAHKVIEKLRRPTHG